MERTPINIKGLVVAACLMLIFSSSSMAQYFRSSNYWKTHRNEWQFSFGVSNFLGELGGRNQIGSPFIWDLEISQTKPSVAVGWRYYLSQKIATRLNLSWGLLAGNDNLTTEKFRSNRNIQFQSDLFEFAWTFEYHFFKEQLGHVYDLRGVKGQKSGRVGLYLFTGISGFYFDPRARLNGEWVKLKPLSTEGQGLPGGPEEYSNYQIGIPIGMGIRKAMSKYWSIGLEFQWTKTFTDYIDDVSGVYYNNNVIRAARGDVAAYFADPSLGSEGTSEITTAAGQQRGDSEDMDSYLFLRFSANYKIYKNRSRTKKYRTRIRRQKIVF